MTVAPAIIKKAPQIVEAYLAIKGKGYRVGREKERGQPATWSNVN